MGKESCLRSRQRGVYALEFAAVFVVFFLVLYALLTFGLIIAAQQTLNFAAEDAARSALRWQSGDEQESLSRRMAAAKQRAADLTGWVARIAGSQNVQVQVCPRGDRARQVPAVGGHDALCENELLQPSLYPRDSIEVLMRYGYRDGPLVPMLGPDVLFGVLVPDALYGRALVDLQIGLFQID